MKLIPKRFIFTVICNNCGRYNPKPINLGWMADKSLLMSCENCGEIEKISLDPSPVEKEIEEKLIN